MSSILVIGESGSGKSTSLRNIDGKATILINALNKPLPFKGGKKKFGDHIIFTDDSRIIVNKIREAEKNKNIKLIVVDDFQAILTNAFMSTIETKGYEKFTRIGRSVWDIVNAANNCRSDLKVVLLAHSETDANGKIKCKTVGKLVDDKIVIEGMCTVVLQSKVANGRYTFLTQNDGTSVAKSPIGMFASLEIDNDLAEVVKAIDAYYDEDDIPLPIVAKPVDIGMIITKICTCNTVEELTEVYKEECSKTLNDDQRKELIDSCAKRKQEILKAKQNETENTDINW